MALTLDQVIETATAEFAKIMDIGDIYGAKDADEQATELACVIAERFGYEYPDSDEYEAIVSALFALSSDRFPGDW